METAAPIAPKTDMLTISHALPAIPFWSPLPYREEKSRNRPTGMPMTKMK